MIDTTEEHFLRYHVEMKIASVWSTRRTWIKQYGGDMEQVQLEQGHLTRLDQAYIRADKELNLRAL
jgi:hypothetical protein